MTTLFEDTERSYLGPANNNETQFEFYNRSARKDISIIRSKLNDWFLKIPESEKKEFKSRFKNTFDDTFYELFLFNLFQDLGFTIEIHPVVPNSSKRPDFLIRKDKLEIYVEAKISKDKSAEQEAFERMENQFYDSMNKINSDNFMLAVEKIRFISGLQPKTNVIRKYVETELLKLDPDHVTENMKVNGVRNIKIEYKDSDLHIVLNPIPVIPNARLGSDRRAIGMYPFESYNDGGEVSLKNSINFKAKRYGELDKPFIICVNALGKNTTSIHDIDNAIWGSLTISYSENPNNRDEKWIRQPDGIFQDINGPKRKDLTAVLINKVFHQTFQTHNIGCTKILSSKMSFKFKILV